MGIVGQKCLITLFGRLADVLKCSVLEVDIFALYDDPEIPVEFMRGYVHIDDLVMFDLENYGRLDRLYIQEARRLIVETGQIGGPVIFNGKLNIVFFPILVGCIQPEAACNDIGEMPADIPGLQDELPALNFSFGEMLSDLFPLPAIERRRIFEVIE